jgi:hypothetical protein
LIQERKEERGKEEKKREEERRENFYSMKEKKIF